MVGLLGSLVQLQKTPSLLDCVLYLSGVSGSTWYKPWETTNKETHRCVECHKWQQIVVPLKVHGLLISGARLVHQTRGGERQDHPETQRSCSLLGRCICQTGEILQWERHLQHDWLLGSDGRHHICERGLWLFITQLPWRIYEVNTFYVLNIF